MREEGAEGEEGGFKSVRDTVYESYVRALKEGREGMCFLLVMCLFLMEGKRVFGFDCATYNAVYVTQSRIEGKQTHCTLMRNVTVVETLPAARQ